MLSVCRNQLLLDCTFWNFNFVFCFGIEHSNEWMIWMGKMSEWKIAIYKSNRFPAIGNMATYWNPMKSVLNFKLVTGAGDWWFLVSQNTTFNCLSLTWTLNMTIEPNEMNVECTKYEAVTCYFDVCVDFILSWIVNYLFESSMASRAFYLINCISLC